MAVHIGGTLCHGLCLGLLMRQRGRPVDVFKPGRAVGLEREVDSSQAKGGAYATPAPSQYQVCATLGLGAAAKLALVWEWKTGCFKDHTRSG